MIDSTLMLKVLPCERVRSQTGKDGVINIAASRNGEGPKCHSTYITLTQNIGVRFF